MAFGWQSDRLSLRSISKRSWWRHESYCSRGMLPRRSFARHDAAATVLLPALHDADEPRARDLARGLLRGTMPRLQCCCQPFMTPVGRVRAILRAGLLRGTMPRLQRCGYPFMTPMGRVRAILRASPA